VTSRKGQRGLVGGCTLREGLQHVTPHPGQAVLGGVGGRGAGRRGADGHGHRAACPVARGRVGRAARLGLEQTREREKTPFIIYFISNIVFSIPPPSCIVVMNVT